MFNVFLAAMVMFLSQIGEAAPSGFLTIVSVEQVFVPKGFDDNDEVIAVVDGKLPNSCYRLDKAEVAYLANEQTYVITQYARRYMDWCLLRKVPFTTEIDLGVVPVGTYTVEAKGAWPETLTVEEAMHAGPDEHLYAAIDSATIAAGADGSQVALLQGRLTNTCMSIGNIRVIDSGKTIEILPVMLMNRLDECHPAEIPFSWRAPLPANASGNRRLLHVRSLNGKAINVVF